MKRLPCHSSALLLLLGFGLPACGSEGGPSDSSGSGGASPPGSGGTLATGGVSASTGGISSSSGGHTPSGGSTSGGTSSTGGAPTGSGSAEASGGADSSGGSETGTGGAIDTCDSALRTANRDATEAGITGLFIDKNPAIIDQYWADPYLQHNPIGQSGVAAFKELMTSLVTSPSFSYSLHRTLADCELSVVLGTYSQTGAIFDMFRISNGNLVEHWDSDANEASDTMPGLAGDVALDENASSTESELIVRGFLETVLIGGEREVVDDYLAAQYFDHRSGAAIGPTSIFPHLDGANITYELIHHLIADGNYVFVVSEGKRAGAAYGLYDLFRVEDGKIIERWDSRRQVPSSTTSGLPIF